MLRWADFMSNQQVIIAVVVVLIGGAPLLVGIGLVFWLVRPRKPLHELGIEPGVPFRWTFAATGRPSEIRLRASVYTSTAMSVAPNLGVWGEVSCDGRIVPFAAGSLVPVGVTTDPTRLYLHVVTYRKEGFVVASTQLATLPARPAGSQHEVSGTLHGAETTRRLRLFVPR
jgi:hypothetical protein